MGNSLDSVCGKDAFREIELAKGELLRICYAVPATISDRDLKDHAKSTAFKVLERFDYITVTPGPTGRTYSITDSGKKLFNDRYRNRTEMPAYLGAVDALNNIAKRQESRLVRS